MLNLSFTRHHRKAVLVAAGFVLFGAAIWRPTGSIVPAVPFNFVVLVDHSAPGDQLFAWQFCNGVLADRQTVITAAHCVEDRSVDSIDIVAGLSGLCGAQTGAQRRTVIASHIDPRRNDDARTFDVAVLTIEPINGASPLEIIEISSALEEPATAFSWTTQAGGLQTCSLRRIAFDVDSPTTCGNVLGHWFDSASMICARAHDGSVAGLCIGDSGGPLLQETSAGLRLYGIVSWSYACDPGGREVFGRATLASDGAPAADGP